MDEKKSTSGFGLASFIISIISIGIIFIKILNVLAIPLSILGIIFAIVALVKIKKSSQPGKVYAIIGLILSIIVLIIASITLLWIFFAVKKALTSTEKELTSTEIPDLTFNAEIKIDYIATDCYSQDHCYIDYIQGNISNKGGDIIRNPQFKYTLYNKDSGQIVADYLGLPKGSWVDGKILSNQRVEFLDADVFLTKNLQKGEYKLKVEVEDSLTSKIVTSAEVNVILESAVDQLRREYS